MIIEQFYDIILHALGLVNNKGNSNFACIKGTKLHETYNQKYVHNFLARDNLLVLASALKLRSFVETGSVIHYVVGSPR